MAFLNFFIPNLLKRFFKNKAYLGTILLIVCGNERTAAELLLSFKNSFTTWSQFALQTTPKIPKKFKNLKKFKKKLDSHIFFKVLAKKIQKIQKKI